MRKTAVAVTLAVALVSTAADGRIAPSTAHRSQPVQDAASTANRTLTIEAGLGKVVQLSSAATSVFAADPKVAEVRPASASSLFIFGVGPGRTTVAALDGAGAPVAQYDVIVLPNSFSTAATRSGLAASLPGRDVTAEAVGSGTALHGRVRSASEAERAALIAQSTLPPGQLPINNVMVNSSIQVNLRVRVLEMSRTLTRDLGVNWSALATIGANYATLSGATANLLSNLTQAPATATFSSRRLGINAVIDALAQDQLVHMLAEPNLTAMSGQTATFLVGGEFPIPVAQQNNTTTIEFKQYGVSLAFVPTVISDGHINLKVRPEVSQLSSQGAIVLSASNSSIQIPALSVRRAETTVDLGSGQSFAIAGLLQDSATVANTSVPFLGELPIIGALFRSDAFQRNETELVIIVTPYIVRPTSDPAALASPVAGNPVPSDFDRLVLLRQTGRVGGPPQAGQPAAAGQGSLPLTGQPGVQTGGLSGRRPIDAGFIVQ